MEKLIFNSSMPRSGSELLQCILHQNPRIYGSTTSPLLEYQFAARANYELPEVKSQDGETMQKAFISMCGGMAHSYYEAITDRPIVVDKNRGWTHYYEWVEQWSPEPKMICMVRDLRSIIASMEKIYRDTRHTPQGVDLPAQMQNMTTEQRAAHWLNTQPVGLALSRTLDAFQRGISGKILFVRYEDLRANPQAEMARVYEYIGEPYFEHDFSNITKEVYEDDSHFGVFGRHNVKPTLTPVKPKSWQNVLSEPIAECVRNSARWYAETFNY